METFFNDVLTLLYYVGICIVALAGILAIIIPIILLMFKGFDFLSGSSGIWCPKKRFINISPDRWRIYEDRYGRFYIKAKPWFFWWYLDHYCALYIKKPDSCSSFDSIDEALEHINNTKIKFLKEINEKRSKTFWTLNKNKTND